MTDTGIFYGTGAAEGVPSPFCDCPMCNYAREHGGKDVRKRSCFRLGRNIMIDMGRIFSPRHFNMVLCVTLSMF